MNLPGAWEKHSSDEVIPGKTQGFILSPKGTLCEPVPLKRKPFSSPETSSHGLSWSEECRLPPLADTHVEPMLGFSSLPWGEGLDLLWSGGLTACGSSPFHYP